MIKSIDHILVAVEELDKAVEDYSLVFWLWTYLARKSSISGDEKRPISS